MGHQKIQYSTSTYSTVDQIRAGVRSDTTATRLTDELVVISKEQIITFLGWERLLVLVSYKVEAEHKTLQTPFNNSGHVDRPLLILNRHVVDNHVLQINNEFHLGTITDSTEVTRMSVVLPHISAFREGPQDCFLTESSFIQISRTYQLAMWKEVEFTPVNCNDFCAENGASLIISTNRNIK